MKFIMKHPLLTLALAIYPAVLLGWHAVFEHLGQLVALTLH